MGSTVSIPLLKTANKNALIDAFNLFPYPAYEPYIWMSDDPENHVGAKNYRHGIFYSKKTMPNDISYYLRFYCSRVVSKFGPKKRCKVTNKNYPYFYDDVTTVYVIPEEDKHFFNNTDYEFSVIGNIDNINIHSNIIDIEKKYTKDEINLFFGDNELLKLNCQHVLDVINGIK